MVRWRVLQAAVTLLIVGPLVGVACTGVPTFSAAPDVHDGGGALDVVMLDSAPSSEGGSSESGSPETGPTSDGGPRRYGLFASAATRFGNFGGTEPRDEADKFCDSEAKQVSAGYTGTWLALIWTVSGGNPGERIHPSPGGWHQTLGGGKYGEQVLTTLSDNGRAPHEILTQFGGIVPGGIVWTGGSLAASGDSCLDWAGSGAAEGVLGSTTASTSLWMNAGSKGKCGIQSLSIYCIEQPPLP